MRGAIGSSLTRTGDDYKGRVSDNLELLIIRDIRVFTLAENVMQKTKAIHVYRFVLTILSIQKQSKTLKFGHSEKRAKLHTNQNRWSKPLQGLTARLDFFTAGFYNWRRFCPDD